MLNQPPSRRAFLAASGTALATLWLAADPEAIRACVARAAGAARRQAPLPWEVLTPEQAADVDAIAAQIFPTDDTPGAREARVVAFIDHSLATWAAPLHRRFAEGLEDLNDEVRRRWRGATRFAHLDAHRQIKLLRARERTRFFREMRLLTLAGMFTLPSYGGNRGKAGWQLIGFEDRFAWRPPFGDYDADVAHAGG